MELNKNQIKKITKKQKRHKVMLTKETGVECYSIPTKHLAICNVGQVNGLTEEIVLNNFRIFGDIENVLLLPGKSYGFLSFKNTNSAKEAMDKCNGILPIAQDNKPIYLSFIKNLPQIENEKSNQLPPGLIIIDDFITEDEEKMLLNLCNSNDFNDSIKHRLVKHFGYEFIYCLNNVDKNNPLSEKIPEECNCLWERLTKYNFTFKPDQLTVNYYKPGQGIPPHIDTHSAFEDPIISLSLSSPIVMDFKRNNQKISVLLRQRSLTIMSGESRYAWSHGITPRKYDFYEGNTLERSTRISFTFRKILKSKCNCNYKEYCDLDNKTKIDENKAKELEVKHVYQVYENIAEHFSDTRHKPWPKVLEFVNNFKIGDILMDVGCGNGKYMGWNKGIYEIGCDTSFGLIDVCKQKKFNAILANALSIPLKDNCVDGVISIAVIHHLASENRRLKAISEIIRILKNNGLALIYVWAKDQQKDKNKTSYIKQDRKHRKGDNLILNDTNNFVIENGIKLPIHTNRTQFKYNDMLVPWKLKETNKSFLRFYHVFEEGELDTLCKKIENVQVIDTYYDQGNWCIIIQKKKSIKVIVK